MLAGPCAHPALTSFRRHLLQHCVHPQIYIRLAYHPYAHDIYTKASTDPKVKLECFAAGARMVTRDAAALEGVLRLVAQQGSGVGGGGTYACPSCLLDGLTENELVRCTYVFRCAHESRVHFHVATWAARCAHAAC